MTNDIRLRIANLPDCKSILEIYSYYVLNSSITFEYDIPSLGEMESRMNNIQKKYPYLVAEADGKIAGYAYASEFRTKAAYQWSAESTIYLSPDFQGRGIGKKLYVKLFELLRQQGYFNVYGGVTIPNDASISLHESCGFKAIGMFEDIGFKNGMWHTTKWFHLKLRDHIPDPPSPRKIDFGKSFL